MTSESAPNQLAELIEAFYRGKINSSDYRDGLYSIYKNCPMEEIVRFGIREVEGSLWPTYSDWPEKLSGLTSEGHEHYQRCILFLRSGLDYEWPIQIPVERRIKLMMHSLKVLFCRITHAPVPAPMKRIPEGDESVWPFFRRSDYVTAKEAAVGKEIIFLDGNRAAVESYNRDTRVYARLHAWVIVAFGAVFFLLGLLFLLLSEDGGSVVVFWTWAAILVGAGIFWVISMSG